MSDDRAQVIARGRAYVRLIEAADMLLTEEIEEAERTLLRRVRRTYTHKLRELVAELPPEVTAEILAASERIGGSIQSFSKN